MQSKDDAGQRGSVVPLPAPSPSPDSSGDALLRLPAVKARVGLGKTAIYALVRAHRFPQPIKHGARVTCWRSSEIDEYVQQVVRQSRVAA